MFKLFWKGQAIPGLPQLPIGATRGEAARRVIAKVEPDPRTADLLHTLWCAADAFLEDQNGDQSLPLYLATPAPLLQLLRDVQSPDFADEAGEEFGELPEFILAHYPERLDLQVATA